MASILMLLALAVPASSQDCVEGTITAEYQTSGPYALAWKYTLEVTWDAGAHGLSHLTFDLDLDSCPCICDPVIFFDSPAGESNGEPEPCTVHYAGDFVCHGDPAIPGQQGVAIKWDAISAGCEPGRSGTGTFVFYSLLGPGDPVTPTTDNLWIKFGPEDCSGVLSGRLPICDGCPLPVESTTWGHIKAVY
jgi:hypothetical protein